MKKILLTLVCLFLAGIGSGQEIYLETLSVRSSSFPAHKSIFTITRQDIGNSTATNIADLLSRYGIATIQRRGAFGLSGDISILGTTFDQGIIKVNGLIVNDPQTGHHNLDIPVPLESIERIEITPQAINIITIKQPLTRFKLDLLGGQHRLWGGTLAINNITYQHLASSGWRDNTEFNNDTWYYQLRVPSSKRISIITFGYERKDFGAYRFYSQNFPAEKEKTSTLLASGQTEYYTGLWHWQPQGSFRLHRDYFILDRDRPDWSFNDHRNSTIFLGLPVTLPIKQHKLIAGFDFKQEAINSSNLQQHHRNTYSCSTRFLPQLNAPWQMELGLREDWYAPAPVRRVFRPAIEMDYGLSENWSWQTGLNRFYRLPTLTELYYKDPANQGSISLDAEKGWDYHIGVKYESDKISWQNIVLWRNIINAIDWTKYSGETIWQARNISTISAYGLDSAFVFNTIIKVHYQYLNHHSASGNYLSKYNTNFLKHHASLHCSYTLPGQIKNDWVAAYRKPSQLSPYTLLDLKISRPFSHNLTIYISGTNLLNTYYEEIAGIPLPGRWLLLGLQYQH
ncbi:MAG: TonB-dependent receptor [bacterium]|jgi:iron complex outermembrane receptor protein|nr:TonB-dependent receptor [bacterium]